MKNLFLLPLVASLCAAVAVKPNDERPNQHLTTREDGQHAENLDKEQDHEDPVTKSKTPKSRVLIIGEPKAASDRWFDWDESCTDSRDRQKITAAFQDALDLVQTGSMFLKRLGDGLPKKIGSNANKENIAFIAQEDPAFTQMFYAQDNRIAYVKETYDIVLQKIKSFKGRNGDKGDGLRFICDRKGVLKDTEGGSYCG